VPDDEGAVRLKPGECAALLLACAFYRQRAPRDAPLVPHDAIEERLWTGLTPPLRATVERGLAELCPRLPPASAAAPDEVLPMSNTLRILRKTLRARQTIELTYNTGERGEWSRRTVRPLAVEQRNDIWYLRAYCMARGAERTFRLDRIGSIENA
jgi:predicted DNA-binding transcriptional regulator YafY